MNRRSLENLRPAKKGEVRNATGVNGATKRREEFKAIGLRVLRESVSTSQGEMDSWLAICRAQRNKAYKGDTQAATWLRDTFIGKPETVLTDPEGNAIAPLYVRLDASMESRIKAGK
jgi:hypothetical protein